jgi:hypothetical protein
MGRPDHISTIGLTLLCIAWRERITQRFVGRIYNVESSRCLPRTKDIVRPQDVAFKIFRRQLFRIHIHAYVWGESGGRPSGHTTSHSDCPWIKQTQCEHVSNIATSWFSRSAQHEISKRAHHVKISSVHLVVHEMIASEETVNLPILKKHILRNVHLAM